jgi:hypothetical protein
MSNENDEKETERLKILDETLETFVSKGDYDVMSAVESDMKANGLTPQMTAGFSLVTNVRENIQKEVEDLEKSALLFNVADWVLFGVSMICMGLTAIGIDAKIHGEFTLAQLFGAISVTTKSIERNLGLEKITKDKKVTARAMKKLLREVSILEMNFYTADEKNKKEKMKILLERVQYIWGHYDDIALKAIQPNRGEESESDDESENEYVRPEDRKSSRIEKHDDETTV